MKVRATKPVFYKRMWAVGETFSIPDEMFSEGCMEKVASPGRPKKEVLPEKDKAMVDEKKSAAPSAPVVKKADPAKGWVQSE